MNSIDKMNNEALESLQEKEKEEFLEKITKHYLSKLVGGVHSESSSISSELSEPSLSQNLSGGIPSDEKEDTATFDILSDSADNFPEFNASRNSGSNEFKQSSNLFEENSTTENNLEEIGGARREKDIIEQYNELIPLIMEKQKVDTNEARVIRAALNNALIMDNPELREQANDQEKINKMKAIINNKKELDKFLKKVDIEKIKEKLKKQQKRREAQRAKKMQKKVNKGGYLYTDEIIFPS